MIVLWGEVGVSPLIKDSPCRPFGTCGLVAAVWLERFLDQLANDALRELHGFLGGNTDGLGGVADLSPKIWRDMDTFFAEFVLEVGESDLPLSDVVHDAPPVNVLLPRNRRSAAFSNCSINNIHVKTHCGNRKNLK